MTSQDLLAWVTVLAPIICSWPTVVLLVLIGFRKPLINGINQLVNLINQMVTGNIKRAKVGPFEIERELGKLAKEGQQAVENVNRLNILMAESRVLELEITESNFGPVFTSAQREKMRIHIDELNKLMRSLSEQATTENAKEQVQEQSSNSDD